MIPLDSAITALVLQLASSAIVALLSYKFAYARGYQKGWREGHARSRLFKELKKREGGYERN